MDRIDAKRLWIDYTFKTIHRKFENYTMRRREIFRITRQLQINSLD